MKRGINYNAQEEIEFEWSPEETINMIERNSGTWDNEDISIKLCHVWNKMEPISKLTSWY